MTHSPAFGLRSPVALPAALLAAAALSAPGAARADRLPDPIELHREIHHEVRGVLRDLARVPIALHREHRRHLDAFFGGRSYYAPHRHVHESYVFPVWVEGAVVYRPYSYCEGHLFAAPRVRPTLWHEWGSPRAARWCGRHRGYFPSAHGCFHSAPHRRSYDRGRDYRRDRGWDRRHRYDHRDWDGRDRGRGRGRGHRHHRGCGHDGY